MGKMRKMREMGKMRKMRKMGKMRKMREMPYGFHSTSGHQQNIPLRRQLPLVLLVGL
jgi:hypothetical protein